MGGRHLLKQISEASRDIWDRPETRSAVRKNFAKVIDCGTPALGWELYASDNEKKRCCHRCRSRFCASCGYPATLLWLEYQEAALPDIPYTGIVFTMPRELWSIFKRNRHLLHDLPVLGADVIQQWIRMKFGVSALVIVVAHTFGADLKFNTHLHILISAGGLLESEGRWIPRIELHKNALMRMWRYAVITHLRGALKAKVIESHLAVEDLKRILTIAYERHPKWIIFIDKIASKSHFLRYAARYVRRPPLASWRVSEVTDGKVVFVAKDTKTKSLFPTPFQLSDFVRLLTPHVPDSYRHSVRYFGLLSPRARGRMQAALFALLGQCIRRPQRLSGSDGMRRWVGLGIIADNLINLGGWLAQQPV